MKMQVFDAPIGQQSPLIEALIYLGSLPKNQGAVLKLLRIRRRVNAVAEDFASARLELIKKYGDGNDREGWTVRKADLPMFLEEYRELCNQDVPEDMLKEKISIEDLWYRGTNGERVQLDLEENHLERLGELLEYGAVE